VGEKSCEEEGRGLLRGFGGAEKSGRIVISVELESQSLQLCKLGLLNGFGSGSDEGTGLG
jgi:hypothetical protein